MFKISKWFKNNLPLHNKLEINEKLLKTHFSGLYFGFNFSKFKLKHFFYWFYPQIENQLRIRDNILSHSLDWCHIVHLIHCDSVQNLWFFSKWHYDLKFTITNSNYYSYLVTHVLKDLKPYVREELPWDFVFTCQ